ncbi:MAG: FtsB family cell division protein [Limisphaerales bacterium]
MNKQVNLGMWHRLSQVVIGLIVMACLLGVFFWYLPVFEQNAQMRQEILSLENDIRLEEEKRKQFETAIRNLKEDPKTVERLAREKLGYAKPGETVIFFEPPKSAF